MIRVTDQNQFLCVNKLLEWGQLHAGCSVMPIISHFPVAFITCSETCARARVASSLCKSCLSTPREQRGPATVLTSTLQGEGLHF